MGDLDFSKDGVSVVGEDDTAHRVEEHLEHGSGTQSGLDHVGHSFSYFDVGELGFAPGLALGVLVQDEDGC